MEKYCYSLNVCDLPKSSIKWSWGHSIVAPLRWSQESEGFFFFFFLNEVCDEEERLNLAPHHRDTGKDSDLQAMEGTIQ